MSIKLKIKSKHLALEAGVIRFEEQKLKRQIEWLKQHQKNETETSIMGTWNSLNSHRRFEVRNEARATYLARAYIEGRKYETVEIERKDNGTFYSYIMPRVVSMVIRYKLGKIEKFMKPDDVKAVRDEIKAWCNE
jgi:hypothetical protein